MQVDTPGQCIALVDLATKVVRLVSRDKLAELVQQRSGGRYH
jgi:hypothetical protein